VAAIGSEDVRRTQDQQRCRGVAQLERGDPGEQPPQLTAQDRPHADPQRRPLLPPQPRSCGDRDKDRGRSEEARHERQQDRVPDPNRRDQTQCEERPGDRARVVHRALEAVGAPVGIRLDDVGEQGIPRGRPQAA
jgi:hypothetical protein